MRGPNNKSRRTEKDSEFSFLIRVFREKIDVISKGPFFARDIVFPLRDIVLRFHGGSSSISKKESNVFFCVWLLFDKSFVVRLSFFIFFLRIKL